MTSGSLEIHVGLKAMQARRAADLIANALDEGISTRGRATLAVSGGSTAAPLFEALADLAVPWSQVGLVQVDERVAPDGHPDRNLVLLERHLLGQLPDARPRVHPMPVTVDDLQLAAREYTHTLETLAGAPPELDVVHLGLGADGHTASLLPQEDTGRTTTSPPVVLTGPHEGRRRMTLSLPTLSAARRIVWLASGPDKADAVRRLVHHDDTIPAAAVARSHAVLLVDRAAAAEL